VREPQKDRQNLCLSAPFNGDIGGLQRLLAAGARKFYGCATPQDIATAPRGAGRASVSLRSICWEGIAEAIRVVTAKSCQFEYVMNDPSPQGLETDPSKRARCLAVLTRVADAGATAVKLSSPALACLVAKHTSLRISVSKFARVRSPQQAVQWERLGANCICLEPGVLRDIDVLRAIRTSVSCELEILVNDACLAGCPYALAHAGLSCVYSCSDRKGTYNHYYSLHCINQFVRRPENLIQATFVRPEDLYVYENIGVDWFKLTDRTRPTSWIANVLHAYKARRYDGNLVDLFPLLSSWGEESRASNADLLSWREGIRHGSQSALQHFRRALPCLIGAKIENAGLGDIVRRLESKSCSQVSCGTECRFCHNVASQCVSFTGAFHEEAIGVLEEALQVVNDPAPICHPVMVSIPT